MELCQDCKIIIRNGRMHTPPHQFLNLIDEESVKIIGQARYVRKKYLCSKCNFILRYENDKNDPVFWTIAT